MKFLICFAFITVAAIVSPAQKPCTMTKEQLPPVRKLRLGMERSEFENHYQGANIFVLSRHAKDKQDLEGLDGIAFDFHENRLYFIEFDYDKTAVKWKSAKETAKSIAEELKVPYESWRFEPGDFLATMTCADFFVKINTNNPTLTLRDAVADKAKKAVTRKLEEDNKKTVKP